MKLTLMILCFCAFFTGSCDHSEQPLASRSKPPPLTKNNVRQLLQNPSQNRNKLEPGTFKGCVLIPATDPIQKRMVGFQLTGETCSATVGPNNSIRVDFLGNIDIPLASTSTEQIQTDTFVGELENNQVLIVQYHQGQVVSVTQTIYDNNDDVVYGKFGNGDFIKECSFSMTTAERAAGQKNCTK